MALEHLAYSCALMPHHQGCHRRGRCVQPVATGSSVERGLLCDIDQECCARVHLSLACSGMHQQEKVVGRCGQNGGTVYFRNSVVTFGMKDEIKVDGRDRI